MTGYEPMAFHLETERLSMRPWAVSDAGELSALWSERDAGTPGVERAREVIAERLARTEETGIALLSIRRREEGDFIGYCGLPSAAPPWRSRRSRMCPRTTAAKWCG